MQLLVLLVFSGGCEKVLGAPARRRALDLAIAATASVHGVPLLTYNTKDFQILAGEIDVRAP
jgi:predicted nucleic acid-binding protein